MKMFIKKDRNVQEFERLFSSYVNYSLKVKYFLAIILIIFAVSIIANIALSTKKAVADDSFDINWECFPMSTECYVGQDQYGWNQFNMYFYGTNPINGQYIKGTGVTQCTYPLKHEPGRYDLLGKRDSDSYAGDSHGVCHCTNKGYWPEADGLGYFHYYVWSDQPTPAYQSWILVNEWFLVPAYGGFSIEKSSTCDWSLSNPNYSFENIRYDFYYTYDNAVNNIYSCGQIWLNHDGTIKSTFTYQAGTALYFREKQINGNVGKNYLLYSGIGQVIIQPETWSRVIWPVDSYILYNTPACECNTLSFTKEDIQDHELGVTQGSAKFNNAEFKIEYFTDSFLTAKQKEDQKYIPNRSWVMKTDNDGSFGISTKFKNQKISGDDFFYINNQVTCPIGTYLIYETKAPEGYLLSEKYYIVQIVYDSICDDGAMAYYYDGDTGERINGVFYEKNNSFTIPIPEQVKRGDYKFSKVDENNRPLSNIPFKITSMSTGEWHIAVTNDNGLIDTSSSNIPHSTNTNYNDTIFNEDTGKIINESLLGLNCGIWFSLNKNSGNLTKVIDELPALPYDTYKIEEIKVNKNSQYYPFAERSFVVSVDGYDIDGGTWVNNKTSCITNAFGIDGTQQVYASEDEAIYDRIHYSGLNDGELYEIKAWLITKNKQEQIKINNANNKEKPDGEDFVKHIFMANSAIGYIDISTRLNTTFYAGQSLVWMVELYDFGMTSLINEHKSIIDNAESIYVKQPTLSTDLTSNSSDTKLVEKRDDVVLTDKIYYQGAKIGQEYEFYGTLMRKDTLNSYLCCQTGEEVHAQTRIVAKEEAGIAEIQYKFSSLQLEEDVDLVSFVDMKINNIPVFMHNNINEIRQTNTTIKPNFNTVACWANGSKEVNIGDNIQAVDRITYENFPSQSNIDVYSWFVYKDSGKVVTDGQIDENTANDACINFSNSLKSYNNLLSFDSNVFSHILFAQGTLETNDKPGDTNMLFDFDSANCREGEIVAYTYILQDDQLVTYKEDINDKNETLSLVNQKNNEASVSSATKSVKTGDVIFPEMIIALFLVICVILGVWWAKRKKGLNEYIIKNINSWWR